MIEAPTLNGNATIDNPGPPVEVADAARAEPQAGSQYRSLNNENRTFGVCSISIARNRKEEHW